MRVFCWIEIKKMEELIIGLLDRVGFSFRFIYKPLDCPEWFSLLGNINGFWFQIESDFNNSYL